MLSKIPVYILCFADSGFIFVSCECSELEACRHLIITLASGVTIRSAECFSDEWLTCKVSAYLLCHILHTTFLCAECVFSELNNATFVILVISFPSLLHPATVTCYFLGLYYSVLYFDIITQCIT